MKHFLLSLLACFLFLSPAFAQVKYQSKKTENIPSQGIFIPSSIERLYGPVLVAGEVPAPGTEMGEDQLRVLKEKIKPLNVHQSFKKASIPAPDPEILDTLPGNSFNGSAPNDNSFAINRMGQIISVVNTTIFAYDTDNDSLLYQVSLQKFASSLTTANKGKYDPRVIFDPEANRFVIVFLNGTIFADSKVIVAFSRSQNLLDGFNLYALEGNPLQNDTWSDYPQITIGKKELYITMNTFHNGSQNNSGYVESTIRQVDKQAGYNGAPLSEIYFHDIIINHKALFNFTGMTGGTGPYDGPMYFLSNRNLALQNDSIFIVSISGNLNEDKDPTLAVQTVYSEIPYGLPPDARQQGKHILDCNDSRILGGFVQNGRIQFVGNTVNSLGFSGFYHGIYNLREDSDTAYFRIIESDTVDFGYPNISYTGKSPFEQEAIITFNHTGPHTNAGFSGIFYSNDGTYSRRVVLAKGKNYLDVIGNFGNDKYYERWGDYSGSQPAFDEPGVVWASGYNSEANKRQSTWLAKLRSPSYKNEPIAAASNISIYPNPTSADFIVDFELDKPEELSFYLISMGGQITTRQKLLTENAYAGENSFHINTRNLRNGIYHILIQNSKGETIKEAQVLKN